MVLLKNRIPLDEERVIAGWGYCGHISDSQILLSTRDWKPGDCGMIQKNHLIYFSRPIFPILLSFQTNGSPTLC